MFYAEWCEYCKDFLPTWYKLSNIYASKGVKFGLVECDENQQISDRFLIQSYPTLIYFKNNKMHYFEGVRNPELLKNFIKKGYNAKNVTKEEIPLKASFVKKIVKEVGWVPFFFLATILKMQLSFFGMIAFVLLFVCICSFIPTPSDDSVNKNSEEENQEESSLKRKKRD